MVSVGEMVKHLPADEIISKVKLILKQFKENTKDLHSKKHFRTSNDIFDNGFFCPSSGMTNWTFMLKKGQDVLYKNVFGSGLEELSIDERNIDDLRLFFRGFLIEIGDLYEEVKKETGVEVVNIPEILPTGYAAKQKCSRGIDVLRGLWGTITDREEETILSNIMKAPYGKLKVRSLYAKFSDVPDKDRERIDNNFKYWSFYNKPQSLEKGKQYRVYGVEFHTGILFVSIVHHHDVYADTPISYPACYFEIIHLRQSKYWLKRTEDDSLSLWPPSWIKHKYFFDLVSDGDAKVSREWAEDKTRMDSETDPVAEQGLTFSFDGVVLENCLKGYSSNIEEIENIESNVGSILASLDLSEQDRMILLQIVRNNHHLQRRLISEEIKERQFVYMVSKYMEEHFEKEAGFARHVARGLHIPVNDRLGYDIAYYKIMGE